MKSKIATLALVTLSAIAWPAAAAAAASGSDTIPFVNYGGIQSWTAQDDSTLYFESAGGEWYEVDMAGPCFGLDSAIRIGLDTGPMDTFDNFSSIIVNGQRCPVASVNQVASPPAPAK